MTLFKRTSITGTNILTHISMASLLWDKANSIAADVTPQNADFQMGLLCLLKKFQQKMKYNLKIKPDVPKMKVSSPKMIMMGESTRQ